uniref:Uncharacterized protein n=2 Tax=Clytia hemisphaerica TaxID=252671 RepID=A0A7M5UU50_9CNID
MLALLNTLLYEDGYRYANFASTILMLVISIVVIIAGSFMFFIEPTTPVEEEKHDSNLAPFIVIITIIIILLELLIVIGSAFDGNYMNFFLFISGTIQKAVQLFIYHCRLCEFIPKRGRLYGASWYYKTIALINFILWVESIEVTKDRQTIYMEKILKGGYSIFAKAYTALIVDYRLICCILFVEHAFEIDKTIKSDETEKENQLRQDATTQRKPETDEIHHSSFEEYQKFKSKVKLYKGAGVISGLGIVFLQTFNAMVYTGNNMVGPWTNVMGCVAVWSFFLAGILLLNKVHQSKKDGHVEENQENPGIEYLMIAMGLFSTMFWVAKTVAISMWAYRAYISDSELSLYLIWTTVKDVHFPFIQIFQIYLFVTLDVTSTRKGIFKKELISYFLTPFLMLAALAIFFNLIICEYTFHVEELAKDANFTTVTQIVYGTGSPLGLGFSLHIVLHFYTMYCQMKHYQNRYPSIDKDDNRNLGDGNRLDENDDNKPLIEQQNA